MKILLPMIYTEMTTMKKRLCTYKQTSTFKASNDEEEIQIFDSIEMLGGMLKYQL